MEGPRCGDGEWRKQGEAKAWWADRVRGGAGAELDVLAPGEYESEELEDSGAHTVGGQGADSSIGLRHLDSVNGAEPGVGGERQGMAEGMGDATDGDLEGYTIEGEPYPEATEATGESLSEKLQMRQADVVREMVRKKALDLARAHNVSAAIDAFDKPGNPFLMESEEEQEEGGGKRKMTARKASRPSQTIKEAWKEQCLLLSGRRAWSDYSRTNAPRTCKAGSRWTRHKALPAWTRSWMPARAPRPCASSSCRRRAQDRWTTSLWPFKEALPSMPPT